ncbi:hypothetical protein AB434_1433 [Heyndrickxia coagulans]|uniref:Uncharacterized protein n=1 Tax=Heyndrickxia coagulans TaxID=1398 RepID=A0A0C5CD20_HEYCO|nr:hypothetical protein SB48_HM08orf06220 [Heyndrickxia coagulans]AKN53838.1 hypothetical protein AB434_1433 [Heyndrickxia coagulans]KWZ81365.1 hypothetical protein HMPREF3213_02049 [Heyndrickxia coagulans]
MPLTETGKTKLMLYLQWQSSVFYAHFTARIFTFLLSFLLQK